MDILSFISELSGFKAQTIHKILLSLLIAGFLWVLQFTFKKFINKQSLNVKSRYLWYKTVNTIISILGIFLIGRLWFQGLNSVATFLGLLSAGITIALKDLILNMAGWVFIMLRKPFSIEDRIEIGNDAGDVIDIRLFSFTINEIRNWVNADQSTGRIIHIPNGFLFTKPLANYGTGFRFIWNEICVLITFESNWEKAKEVLETISREKTAHLTEEAKKRIQKASEKYMIFYNKFDPTIYTAVKNSGVELTIRFLCDPKKRRNFEHHIWEAILKEFEKYSDIDFAYPTTRYYQTPANQIKPDIKK